MLWLALFRNKPARCSQTGGGKGSKCMVSATRTRAAVRPCMRVRMNQTIVAKPMAPLVAPCIAQLHHNALNEMYLPNLVT